MVQVCVRLKMTRDVESIEINRRVREANNVEIILPGEMIMTIMDGYFIYDEIVRGIFFFFPLFILRGYSLSFAWRTC